jgi:hypothetical protein
MNITEKKALFQVGYSITNYEEATRIIIKNAVNRNSFGVSALAVHGLIESYNNKQLRAKVNKIDMVVPRWSTCAVGFECHSSRWFERQSLRARVDKICP